MLKYVIYAHTRFFWLIVFPTMTLPLSSTAQLWYVRSLSIGGPEPVGFYSGAPISFLTRGVEFGFIGGLKPNSVEPK